jgi:hypothetical protein
MWLLILHLQYLQMKMLLRLTATFGKGFMSVASSGKGSIQPNT